MPRGWILMILVIHFSSGAYSRSRFSHNQWKNLNFYWVDWHKIWYGHLGFQDSESCNDFGDHLTFPLVPPWGWYLRFLLKYLKNYWMDCHEILIRHSWSSVDESQWLGDPLTFPLVPPWGCNVGFLVKCLPGLPWNFVPAFMVLRGWILLTLTIP